MPHLSFAERFDFLCSAVLSVYQFDAGTNLFTHTVIIHSNHLANTQKQKHMQLCRNSRQRYNQHIQYMET